MASQVKRRGRKKIARRVLRPALTEMERAFVQIAIALGPELSTRLVQKVERLHHLLGLASGDE